MGYGIFENPIHWNEIVDERKSLKKKFSEPSFFCMEILINFAFPKKWWL
jgi:hypothetical protein